MLDWFKRPKEGTPSPGTFEGSGDPTAPHPMAPTVSVSGAVPKKIGRYRILEILGQGGMARVYLVEFEGPELATQRFALKTLMAVGEDEAELAYDRFKREIAICLKLHHRNVCQTVDWGFAEDARGENVPYIVMELLRGELLADLIRRQAPTDVATVKSIVTQVLEGIRAVHEAGVIHRDLKPANIFLTEDGSVKIMDFGIARMAGTKTLTLTSTALGTLEFISPEQILYTHGVDHRTDLFNVGLICYEMLSRHLPYEGESTSKMLWQLVHGTLTPITNYREDLPPEFLTWLNKLLQQSRDRRFQSASEALQAIRF